MNTTTASAPAVARPLVSVIVPSYNHGRYIRETLDSIFAQDYRPLEVLVMDGGSTDQTVAILCEYAARYPELQWISEADKGVADAVNKGFTRASGVYAGIQSSDDVYRAGAISEAVAALEARPDVGVVCADQHALDEAGNVRAVSPGRMPFTLARFLSRSTVIHQATAFFRLELVRAHGGWDARYFCCDAQFWLRLAFHTNFLKLDRVWAGWRMHPAQRNKEAVRMWDDWARMIADNQELRRAPLRLRLAARAGRHMVAVHYNPGRSRLFVAWQAWLAVLIYPPSYVGMYPKYALFPGVDRFRRWLLRRAGR